MRNDRSTGEASHRSASRNQLPSGLEYFSAAAVALIPAPFRQGHRQANPPAARSDAVADEMRRTSFCLSWSKKSLGQRLVKADRRARWPSGDRPAQTGLVQQQLGFPDLATKQKENPDLTCQLMPPPEMLENALAAPISRSTRSSRGETGWADP